MRWIEDAPYRPRVPFWTRANVGEVLPLPPSPVGWDFVWANRGVIAGWRDCAINRLGFEEHELDPDPDLTEVVANFGGYAYLCATFNRIWAERAPGMTYADMDLAYFGDHPDVPPYEPEDWHHNPHTTEVTGAWLNWVMGTMDQSELEAQRLEAHEIRANRPDYTTMNDAALLEYAHSLRPVIRRMFDMHINQSAAASIAPGVLAAVSAAVGRPEAAMRIMAGVGGVDSAAPSYAMWDLSRMVVANPSLTAIFDAGANGLYERLTTDVDAAEFMVALDAFLAEFGSRGQNEWDVASDVWETDPDLVLSVIDKMRLQADDDDPLRENAARAAERESLAAEIAAMVVGDPEIHGQFCAAVASTGTFLPGRERSKTNIIRVIGETRLAIRELGRRAVERGYLGKVTDINFLFGDEVEALTKGELVESHVLVSERRAHYDWLLSIEPPFIINGEPTPNSEWPSRANAAQVESAKVGEVLRGLPGCPGTYRGTARVVLDAADPGRLNPGDILVAPHTDPAWTPLFVPAGGVVVDVGAALSHAIIVSRELGIPCVVSATNATKKIVDGATIEVNGDTGEVTIVELP
jgi:pyruvate,water dikinase